MKKLKLETLEVISFETSPAAARARGTVQGASFTTGGPIRLPTYHIDDCGYSNYFDCTFGCSQNTGCARGCFDA